jgi:hypothetical protein
MEQLGTYWTIFVEVDILGFLENLTRKFKFHQNLTRIAGTLHEELCTFMIISRLILLRMRNVSDKSCRENQNTFCVQYFFFENHVVYEIMWENMVQRGRPHMTIRRMLVACGITKATNTPSEK